MESIQLGITDLTLMLMVASIVAVLVKYIRFPYTVALVIVGFLIGFSPYFEAFHLSRDIILLVFLPPLLFEGTLNMDLEMLRQRGLLVGLLAFLGTFLGAGLIGLIIHFFLGIDWIYAFLMGAILSPTDPVSVLATFKELGIAKGLSTIIEGESVFNDGVGVVMYVILVDLIAGKDITTTGMIIEFFKEVSLGAIVGVSIGYIVYKILGRIEDHLVEVMISFLLAYGVYIAAERLHASGVIAVVLSGLIIGNYGRLFSMSPQTRMSLNHFWETAGFILNSLLFLLIGIQLDSHHLLSRLPKIIVIFLGLLLVRSLVVYSIIMLSSFLGQKLPAAWKHVINWGGLRGSIPIALALGLEPKFESRDEFVSIIFGVVLLSMLVQGLSLKLMMKRLGLITLEPERKQYEYYLARIVGLNAALKELEEMFRDGEVSEENYNKIHNNLTATKDKLKTEFKSLATEFQSLKTSELERALRRVYLAKRSAINDVFRRGLISEQTFHELSMNIAAILESGMEEFYKEEMELLNEDEE